MMSLTAPALQLHATLERIFQLYRRFLQWREISRQRRQLLALDDYLLKDLGLNRAEAEREAARWFWDAQNQPRR